MFLHDTSNGSFSRIFDGILHKWVLSFLCELYMHLSSRGCHHLSAWGGYDLTRGLWFLALLSRSAVAVMWWGARPFCRLCVSICPFQKIIIYHAQKIYGPKFQFGAWFLELWPKVPKMAWNSKIAKIFGVISIFCIGTHWKAWGVFKNCRWYSRSGA